MKRRSDDGNAMPPALRRTRNPGATDWRRNAKQGAAPTTAHMCLLVWALALVPALTAATTGCGGEIPNDLKLEGVRSYPPDAETSKLYLSATLDKHGVADLDPFYLDAYIGEKALASWVDRKALVVAVAEAPTEAMRGAATRVAFRDAPERLTASGAGISDEEALAYLRTTIAEHFPVPPCRPDKSDDDGCDPFILARSATEPGNPFALLPGTTIRIPYPKGHGKVFATPAKPDGVDFSRAPDAEPCCFASTVIGDVSLTPTPGGSFGKSASVAGVNIYNALQTVLVRKTRPPPPDDFYMFMTAGDAYFSIAIHGYNADVFHAITISTVKIGDVVVHLASLNENAGKESAPALFHAAIAEHECWRNAVFQANRGDADN